MSAALAPPDGDVCPNPPDGFRLLETGGGFNAAFGPVFGRLHEGRLVLGFRVARRHVNAHDTCHGGALATFADMQGYAVQHAAGTRDIVTPTVSMTIDYLAPATLGDWVEARTDLLRATRTLLFSQTVAAVGEARVFRSSGVYKIGRPAVRPGSTIGDAFTDDEDHR